MNRNRRGSRGEASTSAEGPAPSASQSVGAENTANAQLPEPRSSGGWVPSNTHPPNTKVVASCIDTLYLGYCGVLAAEVSRELERVRTVLVADDEAAAPAWESGAAESELCLGGELFAVRPYGKHGCRYRLFNSGLTLLIRPRPSGSVPCVMAQLRSELLWRLGWEAAVARTDDIVRSVLDPSAPIQAPMLSRVDLCADFQGWIPRESDLPRFVRRSRSSSTYRTGAMLTGFSFGRNEIVARLYDKTAELGVSGKQWMRSIWEHGGYTPDSAVWRIEFQLRREALREFGLSSVATMSTCLGPLWNHLLHRWLRLTIPVRSDRRERWPIDPAWLAIRDGGFASVGGELMRQRSVAAASDRAIGGMLGYASLYGLLIDSSTLSEAMHSAERAMIRRLSRKGVSFADLVRRKARRFAMLRGPAPEALAGRSGTQRELEVRSPTQGVRSGGS